MCQRQDGAMCLPENAKTHTERAVLKRSSQATLRTAVDDIAHSWTDSVNGSVHGTDRVPVRAGTGLRAGILSHVFLRVGASRTSTSGALCGRSAAPTSSPFGPEAQCECAWPFLAVCFGARSGFRSLPRGLVPWRVGACCAATRRLHSKPIM